MAAKRKAEAAISTPTDAALDSYKKKFALSQDLCEPARREAEIDQDYYDGKQFTDAEIAILKRRKQPVTVFNEVKPGVNGIIGIVERGKTDPQALGREKNDSDGAEVITDCLRYVADKNRLQSLRSQAMKDFFIPGICVAIVEVDEQREVIYRKGRYEAFFYDPYSREPDFSDARWLGLANWTDEDDALSLPWVDTEQKREWVKSSVDLSEPGMGASNETTQDRPQGAWSWGDKVKKRLMVVQMWHKKGPIWHMCVFVSAGVLQDGPSEYLDDKKRPTCNLIAQSCYVDRDNKRYGVVRDMRGPQDAINKGWSKALHILNTAKLRVDPQLADIDAIRTEYAKPDGVIEARDGQVAELGDRQLLPAHMEMLNLAEQKMRRQTPTPGIVGRNASSQSGKAIVAEQQAGMTEQAPSLGSFDDFTLRLYRMTGACIKQFWTAPKYIRVTGDENAPRYVLINQEEPVLDAKGQPVIGSDGQPKVRFIKPAEIDTDIIIDSTPDTATLQADQYKSLLELETVLAQTGSPDRIPTKAIIQASSLPKKRDILDAMDKEKEERAQQPQQPGPEQQEQAKAQVQLQANQEKHRQDAEAHAAGLARDDAADKAKAERAAALAEQGFTLKEQALNNQHIRDQHARDQEFHHAQRQRAADSEQKQRDSASASIGGDEGSPEDMQIKLPPELAEALVSHVVQQKSESSAKQTAAAEQTAQAQAMVPQALMQAAQALIRAAEAQERAAIISMSPRKLVKGADGSKMSVPVLDQGTMQ